MVVKIEAKHYTLEEYLELDRNSEERLEYWHGEIFDMSGASEEHDQIVINLIAHLNAKMEGQRGRVFSSNMRVKVPASLPYRYADVSALCGVPQFEEIGGVDVLINPSLLVEVLSNSTEAFDRGDKFTHYKSIPNFGEYLLIAQHRPYVAQFIKHDERTWLQREYDDLDASFILSSLVCELSLHEIYQNVTFDETHAPRDARVPEE